MKLASVSICEGVVWPIVLISSLGLLDVAPLISAEPKTAGTTGSAADVGGPKALLTAVEAKNSFNFETDQMRGTIRLDGDYHGVSRLVDKRTGKQVIYPRISALNLYRLMSVNRVMGLPRRMQRTITIGPHWVEAKWPATKSPKEGHTAHLGDITARYEVVPPNAIDVTVTLKSQGTYAGYELFMTNYFDKAFRPHVFLKPEVVHGKKREDGNTPSPVVPTVNDVFRGTLLVFPRDSHSARLGLDGRWEDQTIQLCPVRHYAHCLAVLADLENQLGVVLMSHPRDCFAISTRYHVDKDEDRLTPYSAFDFSLFGDDLVPGDERVVKVRLILTKLDDSLNQPLRLYRDFMAEMADERHSANQLDLKEVMP